jgi:hypothetical protein
MNLDINNYRARRDDGLIIRARNAAAEARNTGERVELPPMHPRERRVVHLEIVDLDDLATYTVDGPDGKYVVVSPADQVPEEYRDLASRGRDHAPSEGSDAGEASDAGLAAAAGGEDSAPEPASAGAASLTDDEDVDEQAVADAAGEPSAETEDEDRARRDS